MRSGTMSRRETVNARKATSVPVNSSVTNELREPPRASKEEDPVYNRAFDASDSVLTACALWLGAILSP